MKIDTSIEMKAKELGEMIACSREMAELKQAEAELESDEMAKQLLEDLNLLKSEFARALREGMDEGTIEEIRNMVNLKQQDVMDYRVTRNFLATKIAFDNLIKKINDIILFTITGEEKGSCSSHGCGSCSGCK
ncbi:MAG TPA: YlbF family regulator [Clostridiaceae bacterium]|nr:YlbF family regulator [Clostridiaceae bacterium]